MKRKNLLGTISLVFIGIVFGAILVSGFGWVRPSMADVQIGKTKPPVEKINTDAQAFNDAFVKVADKVTPSVVQITVVSTRKEVPQDEFHFFFPFKKDIPKEQQGAGSGVIISDDGYILTNNHVVENANSVTVTLNDREEYDAVVVGTDPLTDLAVIKINAKNLPSAYLGNSDDVKVGQWVMAIGNPLSFTSTITAGIISATGRNINIIKDSYGVENFIQTDAVINPGNSGGALVDLSGAVIGINSAIATNGVTSSYIGYGFAIPINLAKTVAQDLIANGSVTRGYIGVSISAVDAQTAKAVGLDKPRGVMVQSVLDDGAASNADIKAGDVILKIDNKQVDAPNQLQSYVASKRAGDEVKLTLYRDGEEVEKYVSLKARDTASNAEPVVNKHEEKDNGELKEMSYEDIGLSVRNLNENDYNSYDVDYGVMISNVKNYSRAFNQALRAGFVITEVDRKKVENVDEFDNYIENKKGKAVLLKVVDQNGTARFVGLEIPD